MSRLAVNQHPVLTGLAATLSRSNPFVPRSRIKGVSPPSQRNGRLAGDNDNRWNARDRRCARVCTVAHFVISVGWTWRGGEGRTDRH